MHSRAQDNMETVQVCRQIDSMLKKGAEELSSLHSAMSSEYRKQIIEMRHQHTTERAALEASHKNALDGQRSDLMGQIQELKHLSLRLGRPTQSLVWCF